MAYGTFCALLETDPRKAYDYGKLAIETPPYKEAAYSRISMAIDIYSAKRKLPIDIYQLGLKATQLEIDNIFYPETQGTWRIYKMQAGFYWKSNQRDEAIAALQKAIENQKSRPPYKLKQQDHAELEKMLKEYSNQMSNLQLQ
ncbi:MAG TPA: hypothetical protein VK616_07220 [Flavitalea sp.]|nr:hypothetical protein [Flavitalea sp.]